VSKSRLAEPQEALWQEESIEEAPETPQHFRDAPVNGRGDVLDITSTGFPAPHNARQCSPALQQQISLLTANKAVDYYLFDESDQPVPVVLTEIWLKMSFRTLRLSAWSDDASNDDNMAAIALYLITLMGQKPGFNRATILRQFDREYGDATAKIEAWERGSGLGEETFVEKMSMSMRSMNMLV
jgi:hypothetical protein